MPANQPASIAQVLAALRAGGDLVGPDWRGRRGHSVGFGARWRDALLAMRGDRRARELLAARAAALRLIPVDDPGVVRDLDRPADLAAL
jgi:molybdenum cofactor cytidylyltransferase